MPLKPTGFWSYASSDEKAALGRQTQLRALLAGRGGAGSNPFHEG